MAEREWARDKVLALLCLSFKHSCDCDLWSVSRSIRGRVLEQRAEIWIDTVEYESQEGKVSVIIYTHELPHRKHAITAFINPIMYNSCGSETAWLL